MKKYVGLILAIIIVIDVVVSFISNRKVENVFGVDMNVWLYRFLWSGLAFLLVKGFIEGLKENNTNQK